MPGQRLLHFVTQLFIAASCCTTSSTSAFVPDSTASISRCIACSSAASISDVAAPSMTEAEFVEQQLDVCKQIVIGHSDGFQLNDGNDLQGKTRTRFKDHPRCTARFGEVLLHARNEAGSTEEYNNSVQNARSIVNYVDTCRERSKNTCLIREGLIADIATALTAQSLRKFRCRQIEAGFEDAASLDFTLEQADLEILGRLYYSAISRNEQYLREVGLTLNHAGFTALLAFCRATSNSLPETEDSAVPSMLSEDGAKLDAALSNHFNGITAPGCRFSFSRCHGIEQTNTVGRSKRLIVAFSSLGNGLVRHEFGGSLAKINKQLHDYSEDLAFDVLFVADPSQSWYQKDSHGNFDGFAEYERRILAASRPYDLVSLVGDSMGGSGALIFSHLATESVVAFSPQVNLDGDGHVSRCDMTLSIRDRYYKRLLRSVEEAVDRVKIFVHRGVEKADVGHTDQLVSYFSEKALECSAPLAGQVKIIEYPDCQHHQIALHLKEKGRLAQVLSCNLVGKDE